MNCPKCEHREAVFYSLTTAAGMTLFYQCTECRHRWKDENL